MKRKLLTILLTLIAALCLCCAFAACDNGSGNNGNDGSDSEQGSAQKPDDSGEEKPEHVHSFTNYVYNNNATCTKDGTETATCSCGITDTRTKESTALGHSFENYTPNGDATCTENGTETAKCVRCTETDTREDDDSALGHNMKPVAAKEPTCTEIGWDAYMQCLRCHEKENYTQKPALGHKFETYTPNGDATCTKNGTETAKCVRCSVTDTREDEDSAGHTMQTIDAQEPTCTEMGWDAYQECSRCHEIVGYTEKTALGHDMQPVAAQEPTCTDAGWEEYKKCSRCEKTEDYTAIAPRHTITETFTPKQCNGKKAFVHRSCSKCEFEEDETIEDISARFECDTGVGLNGVYLSATVYAFAQGGYGKLLYKFEIFSSETSTSPSQTLDFSESNGVRLSSGLLTHDVFDNYLRVTIKDNYGNYTVYRSRFGNTNISPIEVFEGEHNYQSVKTDPTCTEQGYTTYTCVDCEDNYVDDYTDPLGHYYQKDVCIRCAQHTGLLYVQSGDHYVLIGIGTCTEKNIVIAEEYEGLPVTEIGNGAFRNHDSILSVQIPYGITKIGEYAFYDCDGLAEITIPDSVTEIGDDVFALCSTLKSIMIPASVESIGNRAFMYSNLKEVIFAPESQLKSIGSSAFYGCGLTTFTVPKGVISIGSDTFKGCDDLISVTFEEPSGWKLSNSQALDATQLQTPAIAAAFLSKTYCDLTWTREVKQ